MITWCHLQLYNETQKRKELIREVEMGPFKHEVDDGLDLRKVDFTWLPHRVTLKVLKQKPIDEGESQTYNPYFGFGGTWW